LTSPTAQNRQKRMGRVIGAKIHQGRKDQKETKETQK